MQARYKLPPEWATQDAVMLTWPHRQSDWADDLAAVETVYFALSRAILRYQALVIVCFDATHEQYLRHEFALRQLSLAQVFFAQIPSNDSWARDHGPITVFDQNGQPVWLNFSFTGWGDKYAAQLDNQINDHLFSQSFVQVQAIERLDLVLEGGAIETDGQGALLTTRRCLLNSNRNPGISQIDLSRRLTELFGLEHIHWLDHGSIAGDDTDGHIDMLARFSPSGGLLFQSCDDETDSHFTELRQMATQLQQFRNLAGEPYPLFALPWPQPVFDDNGQRLPASYANFLIINGAVIVPQYADVADESALAVIASAFPGYDVIGIPCLPLIRQYGSLHCVTMQLPRGVLQSFVHGNTH